MTHAPRTSAAPRAERGLTLVELLVSMTIGLVLMLAVISAYLGSSSAGSMTQAQGRMNEDAQAALAILSQHVRMAGYNPKQAMYATDTPRNPVFDASNWAIRGCDGKFTDVTTAATISALTCGATGGSSLAVRYEADANNTVRNTANAATDCLGQALTPITVPAGAANHVNAWNTATRSVQPTTATFTVAESRFYIGTTAASPSPSLYCKGNGGAAQALVENVEDMKITYGLAPSTSTTTLTVAGYLSSAGIAADAGLSALPDDMTRWSKVVSVRVCLVVRSDQTVAPDADSARYYDCGGTLVTPPDQRLRRAYSTTIVLRNRVAT